MENLVSKKGFVIDKNLIRKAISYTFLVLLTIIFLFPFFIMVIRSFMTSDEILYDIPEKIFPDAIQFGAYIKLFNPKMLYFLGNTLFIVSLNVIGTPLTAAMCAYAFSKLRFSGKRLWFGAMLGTMMLPSITLQIPMYIIYSAIGWTSTIYPLIIPGFLGGGAGAIFLIIQFMKGIPKDLNEAAKLDGANPIYIFVKIVLPLILPIVLFFAVNVFLAQWNDFLGPLMYLQKEKNWTLALAIYNMFRGEYRGQENWNMQMAAGVILFLPCVIIFTLFQKQLIEGVTFSGMKV